MEKDMPFWSQGIEQAATALRTDVTQGLSAGEAARRLVQTPRSGPRKSHSAAALLLSQFKSPILLILVFATALSLYLGQTTDAIIIFAIVLASGLLGFWQEYGASRAVQRLLALVQVKADVWRDGREVQIAAGDIVPGDVVLLHAGDVVPGDCLVLESVSLLLDESALTGETFPVEKRTGTLPADTALAERANCLWMGTHVISGKGRALVVHTGRDTEFGHISERLRLRPPQTEFERGIHRFGSLLMVVTLVLIFSIFCINLLFQRPLLDGFLFSLALAVGLTPQLLPAIISINLSRGARTMAQHRVIVKRLSSIENLGSMNVLCSDKTGTLTDGAVQLKDAVDFAGAHSDRALLLAYVNASMESGFVNPIDEAIRALKGLDAGAYTKLGEQPYDFIRKRLSILAAYIGPDGSRDTVLVTKGALDRVLEVCANVEKADGTIVALDAARAELDEALRRYSAQGLRTLGIACKHATDETLARDSESAMTLVGLLLLYDPPKAGIQDTIRKLSDMGVSLKIITGDNRYIAQSVMAQIGHPDAPMLTGKEIRETNDLALIQRAQNAMVFAEAEPNQKERIILALKKAGNVVGYMGDGINDVSALHDADVSISVDSAVDVAKEAADIVLLEKDLDVLTQGVQAGRVTFANTMKYVFMATSANFGNMLSMAGASLFLSFLPLLPKQVLMTNLLTDFPEMTIATDRVDSADVATPRRWNIAFIRKFMLVFGITSSLFDYLTFTMLLFVAHADQAQFRTGWFVESVVSAALIALVVRTRNWALRSRPGRQLLIATLAVAVATILLPYTPLAGVLGLTALPPGVLGLIFAIVALYLTAAELVKRAFYRFAKF